MKRTKLYLLLLSGLFWGSLIQAQLSPTNNIIYVDKNVDSSSDQSGSSWANAVTEFADALKWARENESNYDASNILKIYVAEGVYTPLYSAEDGIKFGTDQVADNTFLLVPYTKIYGGFSPENSATDLTTRNWNEYPTILEGYSSIYHVAVANNLPSENLLDGFIIQRGYAIHNTVYSAYGKDVLHSRGGGMVINESDLTIQNCLFRDNHAGEWGGALAIIGTKAPKIVNSIFDSNTTDTDGLAIFADNTTNTFEIINSSFYNDPADAGSKGAIVYNDGVATISNSIFYGGTNVANKASGIENAVYRNSYFNVSSWDNDWGSNQTGNILNVEDPFIDSENGDFNISICSNAVNNGNSFYHPYSINPVDFNGNRRIEDGEIDMGAIEMQDIKPNAGSISGFFTLQLGQTGTYTTNGHAGGVWSTKEGIIQMNSSGVATASKTRFGQETIYYSFDINGCVLRTQFVVNVPAPDIYPTNNILYVDCNNTEYTPHGSSWNNAIPELASALKWAKSNASTYNASNPLKIYVAKGTYSPKFSAEDGVNFGTDKGALNSFMIPENVKLYGGFSPTNNATDLATRNWKEYPTILDGKNEVYVVVVANGLSENDLIDGFTIKGGNANSATTYNSNTKEVQHNRGAGIQANFSNITLANLIVKDNYALQYGGGYYANNNNSKVINCLFINNEADVDAAAIFAQDTGEDFEIINSTFYNNGTSNNKNSVAYYNGAGQHKNTIFKGSGSAVRILQGNGPVTNSNCYFVTFLDWSNSWGTNTTSNIVSNEDPFVNAASGNFNLNICSGAIDGGNSSFYNPAYGTKDLDGNNRLKGTIDIGAYEYQGVKNIIIEPIGTVCQNDDPINLNVNISGGEFTGPGISGNTFNPQIAGEGTHEIIYTITSGSCIKSEAIYVEVEACVSTDLDINSTEKIEIYPNPAFDVITINLPEASLVRIISLSGSTVAQHKLDEGQNSVNIQNLISGVYQIQIINKQTEVYKFVKK